MYEGLSGLEDGTLSYNEASWAQSSGMGERGQVYAKACTRSCMRVLSKENVEALKAGLCYVQVIYANYDGPKDEERLIYGEIPSLDPNTGAKILDIVAYATGQDQIRIFKDSDFVNDSLYCERAYVVDLDQSVLEVYSGGWAAMKPGVSRFAEAEGKASHAATDIPDLWLSTHQRAMLLNVRD
ncbi:hypothetical protein AC579_6920 [Pseudocercospora musae]|uniref:Uncharacterized protein n=1 Tax=Pseudocercospora musae TaxID=113226 RepID=A0A139I008_9PEZI|nr:hypothetical protein AC579_6920 [Pseudocercospora musae]